MIKICKACNGTGNNIISYDGIYEIDEIIEDCPLCSGTGKLDLDDYIKFIENKRKNNE